MKLTAFAKQLQHFDRHRELRGVPRQPLTPEQAQLVERIAGENVQRTVADDNEPHDHDPLPNRVLTSREGAMTGATYEVQETQRDLRRIDVFYRERRVIRVHQTSDALEVFDSFSHPESPHRLECWRVDYREPQRSYYQLMSLEPDPWLPE